MSVLTKTVTTETKEPLQSVKDLLELLTNISYKLNDASSYLCEIDNHCEYVVDEVKKLEGECEADEVEQLLYANVRLHTDAIHIDNEIGQVDEVMNRLYKEVGDNDGK